MMDALKYNWNIQKKNLNIQSMYKLILIKKNYKYSVWECVIIKN